MTHATFWDAYCLNYFSHLQPAVCQCEIVDFCHIILPGSPFWDTWAWLIKNRSVTALKLDKPIFSYRRMEGGELAYIAPKSSLISLQDFPSKIRIKSPTGISGHARFHMRSNLNHNPDSAEMLRVAKYLAGRSRD